MHAAFQTRLDKHFMPGTQRAPAETLRRLLDHYGSGLDLVLLTGDIVNYPHNASVRLVRRLLATRSTPVLYTPGNHDWLVEGLQRGREEQRSLGRRLLRPLGYRGDCFAVQLRRSRSALNVVLLDNSLLEVSEAQLACLRRELQRGLPAILAVHVPFLLPGMPQPREVLCGDPRYTSQGDRGWHLERRERWPTQGASAATRRLLEELPRLAAPRGPLLAVLAGHEHLHRADVLGPPCLACNEREGLVQYVALPGCEGGHRIVTVRDERGS